MLFYKKNTDCLKQFSILCIDNLSKLADFLCTELFICKIFFEEIRDVAAEQFVEQCFGFDSLNFCLCDYSLTNETGFFTNDCAFINQTLDNGVRRIFPSRCNP